MCEIDLTKKMFFKLFMLWSIVFIQSVLSQTNCKEAGFNITNPLIPSVSVYLFDQNVPYGYAMSNVVYTAQMSQVLITQGITFNITVGVHGTIQQLNDQNEVETVTVQPSVDVILMNFNGIMQSQNYVGGSNLFTFMNFNPTSTSNIVNIALYQLYTEYGTASCSSLYSFAVTQPF